MRKNNFLKKSLAMILSLAMVAPILGYLQVNVNEVQAEETAVTGDIPEDVIGYEIVPANVVDTTGSQPTIVSTDETYGEFADYLFAGWYTDETATTPAEYGKTGSYARFVPADVLSIKCQVTNGVVKETDIDKYRDKYVMRFVSSVDSLDYIQVGFELNSEGWEKEKTATSKSVYSRIESTTGSTEKGRDTYSFSSKVIDTKSEYFITAKYPIAVDDIDVNYTVRAFWVTQDGTKVYGADRCVSVSDGADTILNLSVPAELDETANAYTATYTEADGTTVSDAAVEVLTSGAANSNVRITVPNKNLKSVTEVAIMNGAEEVTSTLYRNLYTEYNGTPDASWYDLQTEEEEFVIATNADLYGFAAVVNDSVNDEAKKLANKTVYLVSDISANPQDFVNDSTDANNLKWYNAETKTYEDAPSYQWNPIGYRVSEGEYYSFCGTFDGGMHTISNIYYNGRTDSLNAQYAGLFGPLSGGTATIKNLKLKDSYFNNGSRTYVGSISGCASGTFMNIYSNAYVENAAAVVGGLFGGTTGGTDNPVDLSGCWFDGNVVSSKTSVGAMFGHLTDAEVTMSDCLITGDVNSSYTPSSATDVLVYAGGYAGVIESSSLSIKDCLNVGLVSVVSGKRDGLITGCMRGTNSSVDIDSSYGMSDKYTYVIAYVGTASTLKIGDTTYSLAAGKDVRHWHTASNGANVSGIKKAETAILGTAASTSLTGFDFDSTWSTILTGTPVPKVFKTELVDTTWYVDEEDTFTLYDRADLYGFAELSQENDFAGKTVKLGDDIVVNTNYNATTWATTAPKYSWLPISNSELPFAGTFDGGMHSIKGIYLNTTSANAGLFSVTDETSLIQNLYLEDSYFNSTASNLGSIAGQADGMFDTVKSTAMVSNASTTGAVNTGGLIGLGKGQNLILRYCWFDGTVSNAAQATGGVMGALYNDANYGSSVVMENCLSSGTMDLKSSTHVNAMAGGFIGLAATGTASGSVNANVRFERCLYTGAVENVGTNVPAIFIGRLRDADIICNYSYGKKATNMPNEWVINILQGDATFISPYVLNGTTYTNNKRANQYAMRVQAYITKGSLTNSVFTGEGAKANLVSLDFTNTWSVAEGEYPVLNFANASETSDKRWYHADATEMILYDRADLYGFAELSQTSQTKQFSGKTIKLGKDIVVNADYDVDAWMKTAPKYVWTPIGTATIPFAGIFDGQLHSISGVYSNQSDTTTHYSGLFTYVKKGTVKNLKLEDSLICGNVLMGSIAGRLDESTLLNVYSNADVIGTISNMGGLLGYVAGTNTTSTIERCWFNGNVTNHFNDSSSTERGTGGLVGALKRCSLNMVNCLNTGLIDVTAYQDGANINPRVGGLIGGTYGSNTYTISQCLNAGEVKYIDDGTLKAAGSYGPIVGYNSTMGKEVISETYATTESCERLDLSINLAYESITQVAEADIKGDAAKEKINFLNYADTCWVCVEGGFPEIDFASTNAGTTIDVSVTDTDTTKLTALYSASDTPYTLYQGELHAHADTDGTPKYKDTDGDGTYEETIYDYLGDDGSVDLATWKTQMETLDLDFAATLDHKQTTQYDKEATYPGLFIYGTEAGTHISDQKSTGEEDGRELHYNMIFSEKSELGTVLNSNSKFGYSSALGTYSTLSYPNFTQTEFQAIIQSVKDNNGLFIIPHPLQTNDYSDKGSLSDFHYADWIGFEVIYGGLTNNKWGQTNVNYRAWKQLLADGAKMWACSGSDTHYELKDVALTSVYSSGKGQSYYMNQLTVGNFTAGSVGIQMCMGDTVMGKECDFTGQRLVVQVGELHKSVYDATHKYRVDVLNDKGVVYSRNLTVGEDMIPTNGTIALDAQDCKFYRVEVFDATTNTRIAIGNPIWNSTK